MNVKTNRKHAYENYEPEINICHDKVKIIPINIAQYTFYDIYYIGYISRYNTNKFVFENINGNNILLDYKDWKIEYI